MATKDHCSLFKDDELFLTNDSSNARYTNLNLNQNQQYQGGELLKVQGDDGKQQSQGHYYGGDEKRKDRLSWNQSDSKKLPLDLSDFNQNSISNKKKDEQSVKGSTLSLHIGAYENNNISVSSSGTKLNTQDLIKKFRTAKEVFEDLTYHHAFEFPRQQENVNNGAPEVGNFKATQKLLDPNATTTSATQSTRSGTKNAPKQQAPKANVPSSKATKSRLKNAPQGSKTLDKQRHAKPAAGDAGPKVIRERALTCKNFKLLYDKNIFTLSNYGKFWRPVAIPKYKEFSPQLQAVADKTRQIEAMVAKSSYLASGTYGSISLCRVKGLQQALIIKTLKNIRKDVEEIYAELNVYSKINSPFFPKLFFAGIYQEYSYSIIMEYISGGTLDDNLSRIAVGDVRFIAYELFQGLQCLHELKLSHNDLKGNNVALTSDGHVKILDFGLSRDITVPRLLPTSPHMAPEVRHRLPAGAAADYYSYGRVLLNLMQKGAPVFDFKKKSGDDVADHFILQCMTTNPAARMKRVLEHQYLKLENPRPTFIPGPFTIPQRQQPENEIKEAETTFGFDADIIQTIFNKRLFLFPSINTYKSLK